MAFLDAECLDWNKQVISYARKKTKEIAFLCFGTEAEAILKALPEKGPLFPYTKARLTSIALARIDSVPSEMA